MLSVNLDISDVVLEYGGDVDFWEGTLGEDDEETSLAAGTVSYNDEFATNLRHSEC